MSEHNVVVRKIENIRKHPNADKLDIIKLEGLGFDIIIQKDSIYVGDFVLLFQDSLILPEKMVKHFGLKYLRNGMVKPAKIRGVVSQAMVLPLNDVLEFDDIFYFEFMENKNDDDYDYGGCLGITKKEDLVDGVGGKTKGSLPSGVEKYDLENVERYPEVFDYLLTEQVQITEKLEGTNFAVHVTKVNEEIKIEYCSRNLVKEDGLYQIVPEKLGITQFALQLFNLKDVKESVTIRGEIVGTGIQGNIYNLMSQKCYVFDIKFDGEYISSYKSQKLCHDFNVPYVPVLFVGELQNYADTIERVKDLSNSNSLLNQEVAREGIVIKSLHLPRVTIKQRSPNYLAQE